MLWPWRAGLAVYLTLLGCVPAAGPFFLRAAEGRVLDADTREPIADALVLEWYRGGGVSDAARPVYHSRWTRSDARGRFAFERALAPSPRMWVLRTYGPSYSAWHPSYGLVHGPRDPEGEVALPASLRDSALRLADLAPYCRGERDGRAARHLAEVACPVDDPGTWPDGSPRAVGETDPQGRRTGVWTFYRRDGTPAARGAYREGAAVGDWEFFPANGGPESSAPGSGRRADP